MHALLGTRKGLLILENKGNSWQHSQHHFEGVSVPYAIRDANNDVIWAGVKHGHWGTKLHYSHDGGASFTEVAAPKFPDGSDLSLIGVWSIASDPGGRVYVGTEPAAVFYSDDMGTTWHLCAALMDVRGREDWFGAATDAPVVHSFLVDPRNAHHLMIGISCGGVLGSEDRGISWEYRCKGLAAKYLPDPDVEAGQDPHIMHRSSDPDTLWIQHHCGLFKSVDNARSWQDLSKAPGVVSAFGWALAIDESDPDLVYTVPSHSDESRVTVDGALFVQRTRDGGKTFEALREGLPQSNCYDICYRHALAARNDHLVFGTTTGNLFTSKNKGESWQLFSCHLPPIYSVALF